MKQTWNGQQYERWPDEAWLPRAGGDSIYPESSPHDVSDGPRNSPNRRGHRWPPSPSSNGVRGEPLISMAVQRARGIRLRARFLATYQRVLQIAGAGLEPATPAL